MTTLLVVRIVRYSLSHFVETKYTLPTDDIRSFRICVVRESSVRDLELPQKMSQCRQGLTIRPFRRAPRHPTAAVLGA